MGVLDQLEDVERDGAPADPSEEPAGRFGGDTDPFSMGYSFDSWELDGESTDHALSILIAVTNLL